MRTRTIAVALFGLMFAFGALPTAAQPTTDTGLSVMMAQCHEEECQMLILVNDQYTLLVITEEWASGSLSAAVQPEAVKSPGRHRISVPPSTCAQNSGFTQLVTDLGKDEDGDRYYTGTLMSLWVGYGIFDGFSVHYWDSCGVQYVTKASALGSNDADDHNPAIH